MSTISACYIQYSRIVIKLGHKVFGFDYMHGILRTASVQELQNAYFTQADMAQFPYKDASFDLAISMWQSVGYFSTEEANEKVFSEVSRTLKPDGICIFQISNPLAVISKLLERGAIEKAGVLELHDTTSQKSTYFDIDTFRYKSVAKYEFDGKSYVTLHDMRYYTVPEMTELLKRNGLEVTGVLGSILKDKFSINTPFQIFVARKY